MKKVRALFDATFDNVETWFEEESKVHPSHSCIPYPRKFGNNRKVIVLVLGDNNGRK